jgi:hypothetical protein
MAPSTIEEDKDEPLDEEDTEKERFMNFLDSNIKNLSAFIDLNDFSMEEAFTKYDGGQLLCGTYKDSEKLDFFLEGEVKDRALLKYHPKMTLLNDDSLQKQHNVELQNGEAMDQFKKDSEKDAYYASKAAEMWFYGVSLKAEVNYSDRRYSAKSNDSADNRRTYIVMRDYLSNTKLFTLPMAKIRLQDDMLELTP